MKKVIVIILLSVSVMVPVLARQSDSEYPEGRPKVRFAPLHIYLDSGNKSLGAYQFELKAAAGQIKIVCRNRSAGDIYEWLLGTSGNETASRSKFNCCCPLSAGI